MTLTAQLKQVVFEKLDHGKNYREISKETGVSLGTISRLVKSKVEQPSTIEQSTTFAQPDTTNEDTIIEPSQENVNSAEISQVQSNIDELVKTKQVLEGEVSQLQTQVEEARRTLDIEKKAADDFQSIKKEMSESGIDITDSARFLAIVNSFKKYNYDCGKIMLAFAEKKSLEQLKEDTDHKLTVLRRKLEEIGLGDFERLRQIVTILMTLEDYGIGVEEIIRLVRERNLRGTQNTSVNQQYGYGYRY